MASKGSGIGFGIRKATKTDVEAIQKDIHSFNMETPGRYKVHLTPNETTFIAFSKNTILGFITVEETASVKELYIAGLFTRLGYDRKGIGSKLLGKLNAYAVAKGIRRVVLHPHWGYIIKAGKRTKSDSEGFYKKTNYKRSDSERGFTLKYVWDVKGKQGIRVRTPKQKPPAGLAPQNLFRKDAMLKRRRR